MGGRNAPGTLAEGVDTQALHSQLLEVAQRVSGVSLPA